MTAMSTFEQVNARLDSDPWVPRENLHPLTGRQVRYAGRDWPHEGTEWIVVPGRRAAASPRSAPGRHAGRRGELSPARKPPLRRCGRTTAAPPPSGLPVAAD